MVIEETVEQSALDCLSTLGYVVVHGLDIAPGRTSGRTWLV